MAKIRFQALFHTLEIRFLVWNENVNTFSSIHMHKKIQSKQLCYPQSRIKSESIL